MGGVTGYDVYFGTAASPPQVTTNQAAVTYNPGTLLAGTTYFWNGKIWREDSFNFLFRLISEKLPESIQRLINDKKGGNEIADSIRHAEK